MVPIATRTTSLKVTVFQRSVSDFTAVLILDRFPAAAFNVPPACMALSLFKVSVSSSRSPPDCMVPGAVERRVGVMVFFFETYR